MSRKRRSLDALVVALLTALTALGAAGCQTTVVDETEKHDITRKPASSFLDSRIETLEKKAREYPKRDDYPYKIAGIYFQKEDYKQAAAYLKKAIALRPDEPKYHYHLGRIYLKMREVKLAAASFHEAGRLTPDGRYSGFYLALGLAKALERDHAGAEEAFDKAVAAEPDNAEAYYFLAAVCDMQQKREKAIRNFREYLTRGGRTYRANAIFFLEKLGVAVDRDALEKMENPPRSRKGGDPFDS